MSKYVLFTLIDSLIDPKNNYGPNKAEGIAKQKNSMGKE